MKELLRDMRDWLLAFAVGVGLACVITLGIAILAAIISDA